MGRIIGIDLGTTTSEIAYIKDGKPEVIINNLGKRITPSVVGINDDNEVIVGEIARRQAALKPDRTVLEVKRLMGEDKTLSIAGRKVTPVEISATILKELKTFAEEFLGETVDEAVITVPANFNDLQRQDTKEAGELAGFKVERIINEPTAAALAYGIENLEDEAKVLVYDLGGGTFDVTVLELSDGILEVKSSRGNNELGGKDFDERIQEYIIKRFEEKHNINLRTNSKAMGRIKEAAEQAKIELSTAEKTEINIPFVSIDRNGNPLEIEEKLTREKFAELISDLVESTKVEINEAIRGARYSKEDIDVVLAVGGSTRVKAVKDLLEREFMGKMKSGINPDETVALGAAVQAGIKRHEISSKDSLIVTDVCTYRLGIAIVDESGREANIFSSIIEKDTVIPCTKKNIYGTANDYQTEVEIEVYQGDEHYVKYNTKIDEFVLGGIPSALKGEEGLEVAFSYNANGILEVEATVISNGRKATRIIDMNKARKKSNRVLNVIKDDISKDEEWKMKPLAKEVEYVIGAAEKRIRVATGIEKKELEELVKELKRAVVLGNAEEVSNLDDRLTDALFEMSQGKSE